MKYSKFWSISLELFVERKPLISEEWANTLSHVSDIKVQLKDEKYPEIWFNGKWSPICGHYFWDNDYGASLFCQKLNSTYTSGIVKKHYSIPLASHGIRVGKCTRQDNSLLSCTGGCNDLQVGGVCSNNPNGAKCGVGQGATHEIECFSGTYA